MGTKQMFLQIAFTAGHLLRCESLEKEFDMGGFRRLASGLNAKHE